MLPFSYRSAICDRGQFAWPGTVNDAQMIAEAGYERDTREDSLSSMDLYNCEDLEVGTEFYSELSSEKQELFEEARGWEYGCFVCSAIFTLLVNQWQDLFQDNEPGCLKG